MPTKPQRLTDTRARAAALPPKGYRIEWCGATPGFGVRVTARGARAWVMERRVHGNTVRRTLGPAEGRGAISSDTARKLMTVVSGELQQGHDRAAERKKAQTMKRESEVAEALTLGAALREYVEKKRRAKDGLR